MSKYDAPKEADINCSRWRKNERKFKILSGCFLEFKERITVAGWIYSSDVISHPRFEKILESLERGTTVDLNTGTEMGWM
jgi:hypothetical protein